MRDKNDKKESLGPFFSRVRERVRKREDDFLCGPPKRGQLLYVNDLFWTLLEYFENIRSDVLINYKGDITL